MVPEVSPVKGGTGGQMALRSARADGYWLAFLALTQRKPSSPG
jgi:hypothetical protein